MGRAIGSFDFLLGLIPVSGVVILVGVLLFLSPAIDAWRKYRGSPMEALERWWFDATLQQMLYAQMNVLAGTALLHLGIVQAISKLGR